VAVIEQSLGSGLGKAVVLLIDGLIEAVLIGLEVQGAGQQGGVLLERFRISWGNGLDGGEILFYTGLLKAGLGEILGGADEDSWAALDGGAESDEVTAGLRSEKEESLLGFVRDGDGGALFADLLVPGLNLEEPFVRWGIGGSAQEDGDEEVVDGLGARKVREEPELVTSLQVWNGSDGKRLVSPGNADVDTWASEIKTASTLRKRLRAGGKKNYESSNGGAKATGEKCHRFILDGWEGGTGCKFRKGRGRYRIRSFHSFYFFINNLRTSCIDKFFL
jgi:hypothetical protein